MNCVGIGLETFQCETCPERQSNDDCACPARWFFHHFGDKWTLPVLGCLAGGPLRFSQFRKRLEPISERMLILTLKKLEQNGLITHGQTNVHSRQSTYQLTPLGQSLLEHVGDLFRWMTENAPTILANFTGSKPLTPTVGGS